MNFPLGKNLTVLFGRNYDASGMGLVGRNFLKLIGEVVEGVSWSTFGTIRTKQCSVA